MVGLGRSSLQPPSDQSRSPSWWRYTAIANSAARNQLKKMMMMIIGNTANEVIYHGLLHLVIPQWSDTYDWAA